MKNYAGDKSCTPHLIKELKDAGITTHSMPFDLGMEVPTKIMGVCESWRFRRAWYYWVADGPGIPPQRAEEFHKKWGQEVRVSGHCGCPSPLEYYKGFAVGSYHIDTQEGLKAFANLLKSIAIK